MIASTQRRITNLSGGPSERTVTAIAATI